MDVFFFFPNPSNKGEGEGDLLGSAFGYFGAYWLDVGGNGGLWLSYRNLLRRGKGGRGSYARSEHPANPSGKCGEIT